MKSALNKARTIEGAFGMSLPEFVCVYVHVCVYIKKYTQIHTCADMCVCVHVCVHSKIYTNTYMCRYMCVCVHI